MRTQAAKAASAIKAELKAAFPGIKFSVTSSNFSNGNSVSIHWVDGPTSEAVDSITGKYQYGHFDGMIDLYEYSNTREDIPQAKFVSCSRQMSPEAGALIKSDIEKDFGITLTDSEAQRVFQCWADSVVYRFFVTVDFSGPRTLKEIMADLNKAKIEKFEKQEAEMKAGKAGSTPEPKAEVVYVISAEEIIRAAKETEKAERIEAEQKAELETYLENKAEAELENNYYQLAY